MDTGGSSTSYPNPSSHADGSSTFNAIDQYRHQINSNNNVMMNRGESNSMANIGGNASFAPSNAYSVDATPGMQPRRIANVTVKNYMDSNANSSVHYQQGNYIGNKTSNIPPNYEQASNSSVVNMQRQQHHLQQHQVNPSNSRNASPAANMNMMMGPQTPNQYGSNENLQQVQPHAKSSNISYRVPLQKQQQPPLVNVRQGQPAYVQRHHQSVNPSNQPQLQREPTSRRIESSSQLPFQNYTYQSNYGQNNPTLQPRIKPIDIKTAGGDNVGASSNTGKSSGNVACGGYTSGQYRIRQFGSESVAHVNPQMRQLKPNQSSGVIQQQTVIGNQPQRMPGRRYVANYKANESTTNTTVPTANPMQQQLQAYGMQGQQVGLQQQQHQTEDRAMLQRTLTQIVSQQSNKQQPPYYRPNYQNAHIQHTQPQQQQGLQVPVSRHSSVVTQQIQPNSRLNVSSGVIQPSIAPVYTMEAQGAVSGHSPMPSPTTSNMGQANVFKQHVQVLPQHNRIRSQMFAVSEAGQTLPTIPSQQQERRLYSTNQAAHSGTTAYIRENIVGSGADKTMPENLTVNTDLNDEEQLDNILSDLLDPSIALSPVAKSSRNAQRAVSPVGYEKVVQLYKLYNSKQQRAFLEELLALRKAQGNPIERVPIMNKQLLDLYSLYTHVKELGGSTEVTEKKLWAKVASSMGFDNSNIIVNALFTHYVHYILPYECKKDKDGIDVKIETEYLRGIKKKFYDDSETKQNVPNDYLQNSKAPVKSSRDTLGDKELTETVTDLADFVNSDDFDFDFDLTEYVLSSEREASKTADSASEANLAVANKQNKHQPLIPGSAAVTSIGSVQMSSVAPSHNIKTEPSHAPAAWTATPQLAAYNSMKNDANIAGMRGRTLVSQASRLQNQSFQIKSSTSSSKHGYGADANNAKILNAECSEPMQDVKKDVDNQRRKENTVVEDTKVNLKHSKKITAREIGPIEAWRLLMSLKSGLLMESTWALDVLNILLEDNQTVGYFNLARLPGLLDAILDHYIAVLSKIFRTIKDIRSKDISGSRYAQKANVKLIPSRVEELSYIQHSLCTLASPKLIDMLALKNGCKMVAEMAETDDYDTVNMDTLNGVKYVSDGTVTDDDLESNFEVELMDVNDSNKTLDDIKKKLHKAINHCYKEDCSEIELEESCLYIHSESDDAASRRCVSISNILRSLSFITGNDVIMSKHLRFLHTLHQVLMLNDGSPLKWWWNCLEVVRQNTLIVFANVSSQLDITVLPDELSRPIIETLIYWCVCKTADATDTFPPSANAPGLSLEKLALESLAKMSIIKHNQSILSSIVSPKFAQQLTNCLIDLVSNRTLVSSREFAVVLISNFLQSDKALCEECFSNTCLASLIRFIEDHVSIVTVRLTTANVPKGKINQEHLGGTSNYLLCCAAEAIAALATYVDDKEHFLPYVDRILNLTMSHNLDSSVINILAQALHDCSM